MSAVNAAALLAAAGGDYQISRSVRLRSSASAYFNRTPASAGNRKTWTWSGWCKRGILSSAQALFSAWDGSAGQQGCIQFESGNILQVYTGGNAGSRGDAYTSAVFRDVSAWYHVVVAMDTTLATATDRIKIFINGVQQTVTFTAQPPQNTDGQINASITHRIGSLSGSNYFDGYLTEVNFIDGQALTPSSFGETDAVTGVWKPKRYAGTCGTNGFYLNFSDNSAATAAAIGKDSSGNGNNWTPNNISVTAGVTYDSMLDVPTMWADGGNGRGNYCVLSPIDRISGGSLVDGNLSYNTNSGNYPVRATIAASSGKWYWEVRASGNGSEHGLALASAQLLGTGSKTYNLACISFFNGNKRIGNGSLTSYDTSGAASAGDVYGFAADLDSGTLTVYRNNVSKGTLHSWTPDGTLYAPYMDYSTTSSGADIYNFGQRPFAYTPPTGFKALNTQNLPEPTIKKGNAYFDVTTYTGTNATKVISGIGFQPDMLWFKSRSNAANHALVDALRGVSKQLQSSTTNAESTNSAGRGVQSLNSDGFTLGQESDAIGGTNDLQNYVTWMWKESAAAGFDIVTYTGTGSAKTVAHSLGVAPKMYIVKSRSSGTDIWAVEHAAYGPTGYFRLNSTDAVAVNSTLWNNTYATSTDFTVGTSSAVNANGATYVAYLFSEVAGYSKFGSYTGNGSTDGPFVYLGFRPRFIMLKRTDSTGNWNMFDSSRNGYNQTNPLLFANTSDAEYTTAGAFEYDILSNGFKVRNTGTGVNASGATVIFAAFAENPFKNSLAR